MSKRVCIKCKIVKPFAQFHKNKRTFEGVHNVCKICHNAASKKRYQAQGEKLRGQMATQRANNYEHRLEIERASRKKNKEAQRPLKNMAQTVRNRIISGSKNVILAKEIAKLYKNPCFMCGTSEKPCIDHIIPLSRGGNHSIGNLMTLCRRCNTSKGKKLLVEWKKYLMKVEGK